MLDLTDPQSLEMVLALIVPGLIITYFRAQFLTGRMQKHTDAVLSYFTLSAIYGAIALPTVGWLRQGEVTDTMNLVIWFSLIFLGPTVFGVVLGVLSKIGIIRGLMHKFGINPVHAMPTAWDWKFGNIKRQWVILTLKNDIKFAGYCGRKSFMSSEPSERDIYIEKIYDLDEDNCWIDGGEKSLWIAYGEIRSIEVFPVSGEGANNG